MCMDVSTGPIKKADARELKLSNCTGKDSWAPPGVQGGFPAGSDGKETAMQETQVRSLGQEDPLEEEMATHSSILAWEIPWTEEPGRLQPMGAERVRHDWTHTQHTEEQLYTNKWDNLEEMDKFLDTHNQEDYIMRKYKIWTDQLIVRRLNQ